MVKELYNYNQYYVIKSIYLYIMKYIYYIIKLIGLDKMFYDEYIEMFIKEDEYDEVYDYKHKCYVYIGDEYNETNF